ncbi:MAG: STAS domain-containing protein [Myxococcota bacterium]
MLSIREEQKGGILVLHFTGDLEASVEAEAAARLEEIGQKGLSQKLVLDVGELKLIDSSGIGVIVGFFKRLRAGGGDMKMARLGGQPATIMKLLRLDKAIEPCDSVDAAIAKFAG